MARGRSAAKKFSPSEIVVHFDDPPESSSEVLAEAKRAGIELDMTPRELDELRARGPEFRRWLAREPGRHETFVRDPEASLAALDDQSPPRSRRRASAPAPARWMGVGAKGEAAAAGAEVAAWTLADPDRLQILMKDPASAIEAALVGAPTRVRKLLLEDAEAPKRAKGRRSTATGRGRSSRKKA